MCYLRMNFERNFGVNCLLNTIALFITFQLLAFFFCFVFVGYGCTLDLQGLSEFKKCLDQTKSNEK